MTIFLVGMMGCGKSYYGALLASYLNYTFIDVDSFIEQEQQITISEIFAIKGEPYFRQLETETLQKKTKASTIIATGGGAPCFNNNMNWMKTHGLTIFLNEPIDILVKRLEHEKMHRPIIANINAADLPGFIKLKLDERLPFYSIASLTLIPSILGDNAFVEIVKKSISA